MFSQQLGAYASPQVPEQPCDFTGKYSLPNLTIANPSETFDRKYFGFWFLCRDAYANSRKLVANFELE
jgi:hypothetical protein